MMRLKLFGRYATLISLVVSGLILAMGVGHFQFARTELLKHLHLIQSERATNAASQIERFVLDIDNRLSELDMHREGSLPDRSWQLRLDAIRLMRQVPAVSSVSWIGSDGIERIYVSRLELDRMEGKRDLSATPQFQRASNGKPYFSPPYFFQDSEPYMTLAKPAREGGVISAEVNLKFIWDIVARLSSAASNNTYVVGPEGALLAHLDLAAVLRRTNVSSLPQVAAAQGGKDLLFGTAFAGEEVISAHAAIPLLQWLVFVESPRREYELALNASIRQTVGLLIGGILIATAVGFLLARTLVRPLKQLQAGAERIGNGDFDQPISIRTGDEVEQLANQFNHMTEVLKASYTQLETRVAERTEELAKEKERSHALLLTMLPAEIAEELIQNGRVKAVRHEAATILFTDFSGFTQAASTMPPDVMVGELNEIFGAFDHITEYNGVERIKTIGDAYMAAAGVSGLCPDHARRCVLAAKEMVAFLTERNRSSAFKWNLRVGIHSGPVVAGVVGTRKFAFDIWGDTVNLASRLESAGEVGRINISAYTYHLIQSEFVCEYRGKISVKGKGDVDMYFVSDNT